MKERRAVLRACRALFRGILCIDVLLQGIAGRCSKSFWDWDALHGRLKGANPKTGQKSVVLGLTGHTVHSERGQSQVPMFVIQIKGELLRSS